MPPSNRESREYLSREYEIEVNVNVIPDGYFGFDHDHAAPNATLENTDVSRDEVAHPSYGRARRITVAYTLSLNNETFQHLYEFFSEADDESGSASWDQFVELITKRDNDQSLIYHAKRNGEVMAEFLDMCEENNQAAAAA